MYQNLDILARLGRIGPMLASDFDYTLPPRQIAQEPARPRDSSRLMVLDRETGKMEHRRFFEIGDYLRPGDLLVVNRSKVFKARLVGVIARNQATKHSPEITASVATFPPRNDARESIEIFLLRPDDDRWLALAKPGRKLKIGTVIEFHDGSTCTVAEKMDNGTVALDFGKSSEEVLALTDCIGQVPTPPYVGKIISDAADYQTVYAQEVGSVAAPTAGFHFTPELIAKLKTQGIKLAEVILHVGLGTFRPIKTETLEGHEMHEEWLNVPKETRHAIEQTKQSGGRVIAVGTTTVRALESGIDHGFTKIFITPGYKFKTVDGLITNFHLPKSTLVVLVSAFAGEHHVDADWGRQTVLHAYSTAISEGYRFYSFGDAMLII
jgi:S-adenosylmethionine:tRNA ribosyltransferase-isomerase